MTMSDREIEGRERALRRWFTRRSTGERRTVDGLDIGWGGVQRWATSRMPDLGAGRHLDFACGYGTFLAELGWRFPDARLVGLNIDFEGAHALARPLLQEAGVRAELVRGDAREMPFPDASFDSVSCFMGLQDIEIGFGDLSVRQAVRESVRVARPGGTLCLLDEYPHERLEQLVGDLPVRTLDRGERELGVRWDRATAECAVTLYSQGWLEQRRLGESATAEQEAARYADELTREAKRQLAARGYYVPFGPVRMVVCRKAPEPPEAGPPD
jgi:ubiquinone/menaquinone biosynthesis C-methylase UbiE